MSARGGNATFAASIWSLAFALAVVLLV